MRTVTYTVLDIQELEEIVGNGDWGSWYEGENSYYYGQGVVIEVRPEEIDRVLEAYPKGWTDRFHFHIAYAMKEGLIPKDHTVQVRIDW